MYITCVLLFVFDNIVYMLSQFMPVGCGLPEPVLSPAVQYFLACGRGCVDILSCLQCGINCSVLYHIYIASLINCIQPDDSHSSNGRNI